MEINFHAEAVAVVHPDNMCFLVGFADDKLNTEQYLMLQRSFEDDVDQQEVELGHDTYYLEWRDQAFSLYGGVQRFVLRRDHITCTFSPAGTAALDGATSARIGFKLDEPEFRLLRQRLKDIFRASDVLQVHAD